MKIAVVALLHHPVAEPFAGGMEAHTWWLAKKLIAKGHEVTLFASGDSDPNMGLAPCIETALASHPRAQTLPERQACNMSAYAHVIKQICQGKFDVVHNNALHPLVLLSAADLPVPMLTVLHTPPYPELAAAVRYATARNRPDHNSRNNSGRMAIAAVSKSLALKWQPLTDAHVVYNGIEIDNWPYTASHTGQIQPKQALWYGRIVPEKAPHLAIQAALMAGYAIEVAGPIADTEYFEKQVKPLLKSPHVNYQGHLSHDEIRSLLTQSSVFVNTPLWEEPYGFVYAEALASGTPIATFDSGAASEILTPDCGVVVQEKTVEALAEAIAIAAQLSRQNCRQRAESFCHIDSMIDGYEQLYQQLIYRQQQQNIQPEQAVNVLDQGPLPMPDAA